MTTYDVTVLKNPLVPCPRCGLLRVGGKAALCRDCKAVLSPVEREAWAA